MPKRQYPDSWYSPRKPKRRRWRPNRDIDRSGWTNERRAERAAEALSTFMGSDHPDESHLPDLLCNLMHLCDRDQRNFDDLLAHARRGYEDER
jgi:hypothetical protein